ETVCKRLLQICYLISVVFNACHKMTSVIDYFHSLFRANPEAFSIIVARNLYLSVYILDMIDEKFLNHLLDIVENTRDEEDETFNYSIIRLLLSFNEQFMLAAMAHQAIYPDDDDDDWNHNTLLRVLSMRIGTSKTFGENVIFMLNRAVEPHLQMLILKLLYEIFITPETYEYFYTNDLHVLIDVFIRELCDLPEESEALRHTYLRVLYPLLANTQLNQYRYKQHHIYNLLLDLIGSSTNQFKPVSPTTQRLVDRCLLSEYFDGIAPPKRGDGIKRVSSSTSVMFPMNTHGTSTSKSIIFPINTNGNVTGNNDNGMNPQGKYLRTTTI
ncbi:9332_t:CDS:2, partial [Acaulospora morrowiae]